MRPPPCRECCATAASGPMVANATLSKPKAGSDRAGFLFEQKRIWVFSRLKMLSCTCVWMLLPLMTVQARENGEVRSRLGQCSGCCYTQANFWRATTFQCPIRAQAVMSSFCQIVTITDLWRYDNSANAVRIKFKLIKKIALAVKSDLLWRTRSGAVIINDLRVLPRFYL